MHLLLERDGSSQVLIKNLRTYCIIDFVLFALVVEGVPRWVDIIPPTRSLHC
jgi:hypothetical protein